MPKKTVKPSAGGETPALGGASRRSMALQRLSICPCGYGVLKDSITLGTVYIVDLGTLTDGFTYICDRCGVAQTVACVHAMRPGTKDGYLPYGLFEIASKQPGICPTKAATQTDAEGLKKAGA